METQITDSVFDAANFIKKGGIVAFPTETVYGLAADIFNAEAIANVFKAKARPNDNPLIAHIANLSQISEIALEVPKIAQILFNKFFPGALTIVLRKKETVPPIATAGLETLGVRMPESKIANRFISACGVPLVAPSANISGKPSPTTWQAVYEDLDGRIDCILKGETSKYGIESTVIDVTTTPPLLLRRGAVTLETLQCYIPEITAYEPKEHEVPKSPGMKHKHYSPVAKVRLAKANDNLSVNKNSAFIGFTVPNAAFKKIYIAKSDEDYAQNLFEFFRECDRTGIDEIFCEQTVENGIGAALMERIRRASK